MTRLSRTLLIAASTACLGALAGCGGDDDDTAAGGAAGSAGAAPHAGKGGKGGSSGEGGGPTSGTAGEPDGAGADAGGAGGSTGGSGNPNGGTGGSTGGGGNASGDAGDGSGGTVNPHGGTGGSTGGTGGSTGGTGGSTGGTGGSTGGTGGSTGGTGGSTGGTGNASGSAGEATGGAGESNGGNAGGGGDAGSGGGPSGTCVKVAPDGDDALGASSGGLLAFRNVDVALAYAGAHRSFATKVCVAAGASCGASFTYAGPSGEDLAMQDGISVYANYESTGWTRCDDSLTTLALDGGTELVFGPEITSETHLDGFATGAIAADAATGARLFGVQATTITLSSAPGAVVKECTFSHLAITGNVDHVELGDSVGGNVVVSSCEGDIVIVGNQLEASNFSGSGVAVALQVSGTCNALIDSNSIVSRGGDGVGNVGLSCAAPCTVSSNDISVVKTGDLGQPPFQAPPDRGTVTALSCTGCVEVLRNQVTNYVPVSPFYNRSSGYVVKGAQITGTSGTLVAKNTIQSGCGDDSLALSVTNARVENNSVRGGCARDTFPSYQLKSTAVVAGANTDLHSNLVVSPSPGGGVNESRGLVAATSIPVRNNIVGGQTQSVAYGATAFVKNVVVTGSGPPNAAALNALTGSSGNFDASCYAPGSVGPHLNVGSPCIDAGTPDAAPGDDLDGEARDENPDVGPDEWSAANDPCEGRTCSGHGECSLIPNVRCLCDTGYRPSASDPAACVVDECLTACDPLVLCTRDGDEAVCGPCPPGYDGTGDTACTDIDECDDDHGGCDPLVTCTNSPGSHTCGPCPPGHAGTGDTECIPTSTCTPNPCQNGGTCVPDVSSYTCDCLPGLMGATCSIWFDEIALGPRYFCGVRTDGALRCKNSFGFDVTVPAGTFAAISTDNLHFCALGTDGAITCDGSPPFGAGTPPPGTYKALDTNRFHTCAIRTDDTLACFGLNQQGSTEPPGGAFKAVAAGGTHSCAIASDDTLVCFGLNTNNQSTPPSGTFKAVSLGETHGCGIRSDDTLACWGQDISGSTSPPSGTFKAVDSAGSYSCGIRTDGTLTCWGTAPANGPPAGSFTKLAAGSDPDACALRDDHAVVCWGTNSWTAPKGGT